MPQNTAGVPGDIGALAPAAGLQASDNKFYNKILLKKFYSEVDPTMWAMRDAIPSNNSKTMTFDGYNNIAAVTSPIIEGQTPTAQLLQMFRKDINLDQWGGLFEFTDEQLQTGHEKAFTQGAEAATRQAKLTEIQVCYAGLLAGTSVIYGGVGNVAPGTVAVGDIITGDMVATVLNTLIGSHAVRISKMGTGSTNVDTKTIDSGYIGYFPFSMKGQIEALSDAAGNAFIPIRQYAASQSVLPGEFGTFKELRIILDTDMPILTGAGAGGIDIYEPVIFGEGAFAMPYIGSKNAEIITRGLGEVNDALKQRAYQGWKMRSGCGILYQNHIIRLGVSLV